ncbi:MAG: TVP38/TMEM64 family protein [Clostridia bacterium]|nr:TVP38/TMEM64 family protein [Clostridia bacterium]
MDKNSLKNIITKSVFVVLCLGMLVLTYLYLRFLPSLITVVCFIVIAALGVSLTVVNVEKHPIIYKLLLSTIVMAAVVVVAYIILYETGILETIKSFEALKQLILDTRQWGIITFIGITFLQVVFLPLPAAVTVLIGVAIYGPTVSFILSTIGTVLGSLVTFVLGKIFGKKLVVWMVGEEKTEKYAEMLNDKGRFAFVMMMLFPGFPDDILCLVAGVTAMSYKFFITSIVITRPVMIAVYSYFGSGHIIPFSGWGIPVWIAIFCLGVLLFLLINRYKDKLTFRRRVQSVKRKKSKSV